ncbi:514_t:CDS:2 [Paraglomus occultum]|uniref:514_t:CDS:1 n=1 Tax=Paraglomus occultum TaxID=144539 RepID=A0A9N9CR11_9GLOM|nr:514_t:CDS:2 [Paraglomus occultum]
MLQREKAYPQPLRLRPRHRITLNVGNCQRRDRNRLSEQAQTSTEDDISLTSYLPSDEKEAKRCNSGAWILDMSAEYRFSTFVGVDIAPLFPEKSPDNVVFIRCNVLDGLPFPDYTDFLIGRTGRKSW